MGNRLEKNDSVSGDEDYTYNAANMLLTRGSNSYTNDLDGNTLAGGGRTNTWDSQNRLVNCVFGSNTSSYVYGADGFRHQSTVNGTTTDFALDGQFFVREMQGGATYATYLTGPTGPLYRRDATGATLRWYIYDGLGSVLGEVDASGNLDATRTYDVYGEARNVTGTPTSKHAFVGNLGHTSEPETGLVYMRARYMDPVVGRFLSEDPGRNGANWFSYATDNPVNQSDASGRDSIVIGIIIGILINWFTNKFKNLAELYTWSKEAILSFIDAAKELVSPESGTTAIGQDAVQLMGGEEQEVLGNETGAAGEEGAAANGLVGEVEGLVTKEELQSVEDYIVNEGDDMGNDFNASNGFKY